MSVASTAPRGASHRCPLCSGELGRTVFPYESLWNGVVYTRRRCNKCHSAVVDPRPEPATLAQIFAWERYHEPHYIAASATDGRHHARAIRTLRERVEGADSVLDFGSGSGEFLRAASELGLRCEGIELTDRATVESARRAGVPVRTLDEALSRSARFDVIHLCDVLPCLPDPVGTLRALESLLEPDGRFLIDGSLEANASVVLWASAAVKSLRRRTGRDRVPTRPPTRLYGISRSAQRAFLTERLGYDEELFSVYETGWPMLTHGVAHGPRSVIGAAAILASWLDPTRPRWLGNRFIAVSRPPRR
jgi:SAM-dependent methyltransferase